MRFFRSNSAVSLTMLIGAVVAFALTVQIEAAQRIRLGTLVPKGTKYYKHLQVMGQEWRKAPGGGARLTIYPDGQMGGEADMVRRMRIGQIQAGMLTAVGLSEIEPAVAGLQNLPLMFRTLQEVDYVREKLQPILEERLSEKGFVVLFWGDAGWVYFFSKEPVLYPADLRKMKLFTWAGSAEAVSLYKQTGFNPIPLEANDILPNLQTGLINAVPAPPFVALATQIDSHAGHMLDLNWAPLVGATVITKKIWDKLSPETQTAMRTAAEQAGKKIRTEGRQEAIDSIAAMAKRGLKVHKITPEIRSQWEKEVQEVYPKIRGKIVPADIFDRVVALIEEYRAGQGAAE